MEIEGVTQKLVERGLVTRDQVDRALRSKAVNGGSLALNLVLDGAVDERLLANYYQQEFAVEVVSDEELADVTRDVFGVLPIEIVYDTGIIPLGPASHGRLPVGIVDPSEPERLEEAEFFAGFELWPRLLTVSQMARTFERFAGQPWKVPLESLLERREAASRENMATDDFRALMLDLVELEPVLETKLSAVDPSRPITVQVEALSRGDIEADIELTASDRKKTEPVVEPASGPVDEVVELTPAQRKKATPPPVPRKESKRRFEESDANRRISGTAEVAERRESRASGNLPSIIVSQSMADGPALDVEVPEELMRPPEADWELPEDATEGFVPRAPVQSAQATRAMPPPMRESVDSEELRPVPAIDPEIRAAIRAKAEGRDPNLDVTRTQRLEAVNAEVPTEQTLGESLRESDDQPRVEPAYRYPVDHSPGASIGGRTRLERALVESGMHGTPPSVVIPTVGHVSSAVEGNFGPPNELIDAMGKANGTTRAAFRFAVKAISRAKSRDDIARELAENLGLIYANVLILSFRLPQIVVWEVVSRRANRWHIVGQRFDISEGSVWHHVASDATSFRGTLASDDPLRRLLSRDLGNDTLVLPVTMKRRVVAVVVLDSGNSHQLVAAGGEWGKLDDELNRAFKRIILDRKRSLRARA